MSQRGRSGTLVSSDNLEEDLAGLDLVIITIKQLTQDQQHHPFLTWIYFPDLTPGDKHILNSSPLTTFVIAVGF